MVSQKIWNKVRFQALAQVTDKQLETEGGGGGTNLIWDHKLVTTPETTCELEFPISLSGGESKSHYDSNN